MVDVRGGFVVKASAIFELSAQKNVIKGPAFRGFMVFAFSPILWALQLKICFGMLMRRPKRRQRPAAASRKEFVGSRWKKAPKYVQGEAAYDAPRNLRIQRLKLEAANTATRIKSCSMVSIPFDESRVVVLT